MTRQPDEFIEVKDKDKDLLCDGVYHARFADGCIYRVEKSEGIWSIADGAGWREAINSQETFSPIRFYPDVEIKRKGGDITMAVDLTKAKSQAQKEVDEENMEKAVKKYKSKMQELKTAKKVVKNIERELEDIDDELSQD